MAQTDAEIGPFEFIDDSSERGFLLSKPAVCVFFPGVYGSTHDDERVVVGNVGYCLALIAFDRVSADTFLAHEFAKDTRVLHVNMLQNQKLRRHATGSGS